MGKKTQIPNGDRTPQSYFETPKTIFIALSLTAMALEGLAALKTTSK